MRSRLCPLHEQTFTSTCEGTQAIHDPKYCSGQAWKGSQDHQKKFQYFEKNFRVIIQNSPRLFYFHRAFTYISPPTQKRLFLWVAVLQIHFPYKMKAYEGISKEGSVAEWLRWWSSLQVFYPITNIQVHFQGDCLIWYNGHMLVVNSA